MELFGFLLKHKEQTDSTQLIGVKKQQTSLIFHFISLQELLSIEIISIISIILKWMMMKGKQQKTKHPRWTQQEKLQYFFYLVMNAHQLGDERDKNKDNTKTNKIKKFFKIMEAFIKTRDARQCISHNQKQLKRESTYKSLIQAYFREFYVQRFIELDHLLYEIQKFLEEKVKQKVIDGNQKNKLMKQAEQNIKQILSDIYNKQRDDEDEDEDEDEEQKKMQTQEKPNQQNVRNPSLIFEPPQIISSSNQDIRSKDNTYLVQRFLDIQSFQNPLSQPLSCRCSEYCHQDIYNVFSD